MKASAGKIFNRAKHLSNRLNACNQISQYQERTTTTIIDNIEVIRKIYTGNIAYFGQNSDQFINRLPISIYALNKDVQPRVIYICDINPHLVSLNLNKMMNVNLINYDDQICEDRVNVIPICCDEELWPFPENHLELIISNLHLHWVNDIQVVLQKWLESLQPDGTLVGSIFGSDTLQELRIAYTLAENERYGGVSQHTSPMISITEMGNLLSRLGYTMPTICSDRRQYQFPSVFHLLQHLQEIGENNALLQTREGIFKETLYAMTSIYDTIFTKDSQAQATFEFIDFSGWKYHQSQQKPKKQGTNNLNLGTAEFNLKDLKEELKEIDPNTVIESGELVEESD